MAHTREQLKNGIKIARARGMSYKEILSWMKTMPNYRYMYKFSESDFMYVKSLMLGKAT